MIAKDLITDTIPSVTGNDIGRKALNRMEEYRVWHLPVVEDEKYLGLVSDRLIEDLNLLEEPIDKASDKFFTAHAHAEDHLFELVGLMFKLNLSVLPVVDGNHYYLGSIEFYHLAKRMSELLALDEAGGVLVLEMHVSEYSLAQLSQIIESDNVRILNLFTQRKSGTQFLDVILKLNTDELSGIIQTLARYDYTVKAVFHDKSMIKDLYEDRFNQFMKYMNI